MRAPVPSQMLAAILVTGLAANAMAADPAKTAVFDIELIDMSQEAARGVREDQNRRLSLASDELRSLLRASSQLTLVDLAPQREAIAAKVPLNKCNGCDEDLGKALGADLVVSSIVQKTSNLILSFAITVKEVRTGKVIRGGQVDIRGNTDENWLRGVRWLVKNRLLAEPLPIPS
jgi:hypothetical protein